MAPAGQINFKANAVAKLNYLQMLGYDISWAGFNIIEVRLSNKFWIASGLSPATSLILLLLSW